MDILKQSQLRDLVVTSLTPIGGKRRGDSIVIYCPWHTEKKPSLNVHVGYNIIPGSFQCFGCKAKGHWNDLAKALKLPFFDFKTINQMPSTDTEYSIMASQLLKELENKLTEKEIRTLKGYEDLPDYFLWRGYMGKFYKHFGAKHYWNRKLESSYLYFPLYMNKEYRGYTLCNLDGKDEKYQIFAESYKVFFLYDYILTSDPIVLVEGHFDALRLWAEGISALAIFGIKNWSNVKKSYLLTKHPSKIIIAFDGDKPGYSAAIDIWKDIKISYHNVDIFYLPYQPENKLDPGNMPEHYVNELRKMLWAE
jgi:hypothetical protein